MEELPLLFFKEQQVCWNTVKSQYYAADKTPTRGGRVQTKTVCCHCYSDGELADNKYIDERRRDRGGKTYLPICEASVDDGAILHTRKWAKQTSTKLETSGQSNLNFWLKLKRIEKENTSQKKG